MSPFAAHARALLVLDDWLARRKGGATQTPDELLAQHPELRELLAPMLAADAPPLPEPALAESSLAEPTPGGASTWRGLPGEGDTFGGYRIERLLGQGGMAVVFAAADLRLQRRVALKLIRPERLGSATARERFAREAKLAARLEHPHICPIYEVGESNGIPFMAMRLLHGVTLAARIAHGPVDDVLTLLEQTARAVHFAHEHGVVHRDLKPANIVIADGGTPFVLDFGMALADDASDHALTMTGELAGTPFYMAPEQIRGNVRVDARADVFALGVTLYEAATGVRPFTGQSLRELQDAILAGAPTPPSRVAPNLPSDLDVVVATALATDPRRRYATAAALADELARMRRREPVLARRPGPVLRLTRWMQRNPLAVTLIAFGALVLAAVTLLYLDGEAARRDFRLVSTVPRIADLRADAGRLHERWPDHDPALRDWLARAAALRSERDAVIEALERLRDDDSDAARFLRTTLESARADVDDLFATPNGLAARVASDLAWTANERATTDHPAWPTAIAAIAADPRFRGTVIRPQVGLVPLGPDPRTGLHEFHHPRSGDAPVRGDDGVLRVEADTGIVFVLLPGTTITIGCSADPNATQHDPNARNEEGPPHAVMLDPFFVAKHELTQAQWQRLGDGSNPSRLKPGAGFQAPLSLTHPVESVQWSEASDLLARSGLTVPTEAQWEYACRGGTTTPWWTGATADSLNGKVNLADRAAQAAGLKWSQIDTSLDDGYALHAPVDALAQNGFGLHHVNGNVWEWCRDVYASYATAPGPGDGLRVATDDGKPSRVTRGAAFDGTIDHARAALRRRSDPSVRDFGLGVRAARAVR